ncbi:unnamed protein product [Cylicocyclus nassatus]|uniref:Uncharacterized protein n=1 Tax=Cylicocyclus nassatus TaxID=53992 RepID=A0AA36GV68_CYLNA|nr:unnamed protein product [Cylicocyclus nassatus]
MATSQSFWASAKDFFSAISPKIAPKPQEGDQRSKEVQNVEMNKEKRRYKPARLVNADKTYLYEFGSLNLP